MFLHALQIYKESSVKVFNLGVLGSDLFTAPFDLVCFFFYVLEFLFRFCHLLGDLVVLGVGAVLGSGCQGYFLF